VYDAMSQTGANTQEICRFTELIKKGVGVDEALNIVNIDYEVTNFVKFSFSIINSSKSHLIASAFTFGREDVIPDMFIEILNQSPKKGSEESKLLYYLERHIELDGDEHGPLSLEMVTELCGNDDHKWCEALNIAKESLEKRIALWNTINNLIIKEKQSVLGCVNVI